MIVFLGKKIILTELEKDTRNFLVGWLIKNISTYFYVGLGNTFYLEPINVNLIHEKYNMDLKDFVSALVIRDKNVVFSINDEMKRRYLNVAKSLIL